MFDTITNKKLKINGPKDISNLPLDNINLEQFSKTGIKYIKSLIKYILAFCNILEYSEYNGKYHIAIFETFIKNNVKTFFIDFSEGVIDIYILMYFFIIFNLILHKLFQKLSTFVLLLKLNKQAIYRSY